MKIFIFLTAAISFAIATSCTLDKTDFEAETNTKVAEYYKFKEAASFNIDKYRISIEALNGTFYEGYNEIRLKIVNVRTNQDLTDSDITFLPVMTDPEGHKTSCPHQYNLVYHSDDKYYSGYSVFTTKSNPMDIWKIYLYFTDNNQTYTVNQTISVQQQTNKNLNMTSFIGNDGEQYFIALVAPKKPKIAENELIAGIYKYNQPTVSNGTFPDPSQFSFSEVKDYILQLDPRMPEPSMGNHSSPNNKNLVQRNNSLYYGIVNYTMTGNWTLNFIMLNKNGKIIKGTKVSTDFTPGIEGAKSELYIDILF